MCQNLVMQNGRYSINECDFNKAHLYNLPRPSLSRVARGADRTLVVEVLVVIDSRPGVGQSFITVNDVNVSFDLT